MTRQCNKCLRVLPIVEFHRRKAGTEIRHVRCRECRGSDRRMRNGRPPVPRHLRPLLRYKGGGGLCLVANKEVRDLISETMNGTRPDALSRKIGMDGAALRRLTVTPLIGEKKLDNFLTKMGRPDLWRHPALRPFWDALLEYETSFVDELETAA